MNQHLTENILLKNELIKIDKEIIPVINWFHNFEGIDTKFSCQGDKCQYAYVTWLCDNNNSLIEILRIFNDFENYLCGMPYDYHKIKTEIEFYDGNIRYFSKWTNNSALNDFIIYINGI